MMKRGGKTSPIKGTFLSNLRIRTKIIGLFAIILLFMLVSTMMFYINGHSTVEKYQSIINSISLSGQIRGNFQSLIEAFDTLKKLADSKAQNDFMAVGEDEKELFFLLVEESINVFYSEINGIHDLLEKLYLQVNEETQKSIKIS